MSGHGAQTKSGLTGPVLKVLDHVPKHRLNTCGGLEEARIVNGLHGGNGIYRGDLRLVGRNLLHDDIAGQHRSHLVLKLKRLVGKRGVARTEDAVVPECDADLLQQDVLDVDFGDDAETCLLECRCGLFDGTLEPERG